MHELQRLAELAKDDQELAHQAPEDRGRAMRVTSAAERRALKRLGLACLAG